MSPRALRRFLVSLGSAVLSVHSFGQWFQTQRVSVGLNGTEPNGNSFRETLSYDGRFVAFASEASNLAENDTNGTSDCFVYDRLLGVTELISKSTSGVIGDNTSDFAMISPDGRWVAFHSYASNLVPGDTNFKDDVFLHDRVTHETKRISASSGFEGTGPSSYPAISNDGEFVVFSSAAPEFAPGGVPGNWELYLYERATQELTLLSVACDGGRTDRGGGEGSFFPAISPDGRFITFYSSATNLVPGDTNGQDDIFVLDRQINLMERVSVSTAGAQGYGNRCWYSSISDDGRYVVFFSNSGNMVNPPISDVGHIFMHDRATHTTSLVSHSWNGGVPQGTSARPFISGDGRRIAYHGWAPDIVLDDTNRASDVFLYEPAKALTTRVSVSSHQAQGNGESWYCDISGNGRYVVYASKASNLVPGDDNGHQDIFVTDTQAPPPNFSACDTNCNGTVNLFDIQPFVELLVAPSPQPCSPIAGDPNGDGTVNAFDIQPFISCLLAP